MQQPRPRVPSPTMNFVIAALLGVPGMLNVYGGITRSSPGDILSGLAALVYAALLVRDALHIKKTGVPAMTRRRINTIGLGCLALYFVGVMVKRVPELAQFFGG